MNRWWTALPMSVMAAVPIWTAGAAPVVAIEAAACLFCAFGIFGARTGPVTAGCVLAIIGYAVALWSAGAGVDIVGATLFGLALLLLVDLSEFVRRFAGADIANDVLWAQTGYWLGRAAIIAGAVAALAAGGFILSLLVPGAGRAAVAGLGAVLAVAGALRAGIVRRPGDA